MSTSGDGSIGMKYDGPVGPVGMPGPRGCDADGNEETQEEHFKRWEAAQEHNRRFFEMDKYHRTNPPTELKSDVLGRGGSRKKASKVLPPESDWKPDYSVTPRRIVCAAMLKEGRIVTGARHFDKIMRAQMEATEGTKWWKSCTQGFIDQFGDFIDRKEAWIIAEDQGQIRAEVSSPGTLYSENLY